MHRRSGGERADLKTLRPYFSLLTFFGVAVTRRQVAAFKTPSVLEQAGEIGVSAAKAQMPRVGRLVGSNVALFTMVGGAYASGKCLGEGLTGMVHPINSGLGGFFSGMMLGVYTKNPTVMLGASAGLALAGVVGDVNGRAFLLNPERFYSKSYGLRKPGEGAQLAE